MNYYGITDIGCKRENNEDNFITFKVANNAVMLIVCDGMGGEAGGNIASDLAIKGFCSELEEQAAPFIVDGFFKSDDVHTDVPMLLDNAIASANFEVWQRAQEEKELRGMGTTLVGVFLVEGSDTAWSVNVGDSRLYKLEDEQVKQLTKDHSYVQYLVDTGKITAAEAEFRHDRNIITRAVGISVSVEADIAEFDIGRGDVLLLCSDGLSGMLTSDEIGGVVCRSGVSLEEKANKLVLLSNDAGGDDNITVILAEI